MQHFVYFFFYDRGKLYGQFANFFFLRQYADFLFSFSFSLCFLIVTFPAIFVYFYYCPVCCGVKIKKKLTKTNISQKIKFEIIWFYDMLTIFYICKLLGNFFFPFLCWWFRGIGRRYVCTEIAYYQMCMKGNKTKFCCCCPCFDFTHQPSPTINRLIKFNHVKLCNCLHLLTNFPFLQQQQQNPPFPFGSRGCGRQNTKCIPAKEIVSKAYKKLVEV